VLLIVSESLCAPHCLRVSMCSSLSPSLYVLFIVSESLHAPHHLRPLLKLSPPLLPVQFTQSSLRTAAMPIVCSIYAVKSSMFFLHLFLVLPHPESQSLTRATPRVHQQCPPFILPSPIASTCTSPLTIHSSESLPSLSIYCCCHLFTAVTICLLSLLTVSTSAASASAHRSLPCMIVVILIKSDG
jgi:hypothetical protein